MNEKQALSEVLGNGDTGSCRSAALSALKDQNVLFAGNSDSPAKNTAGDLQRIYRIRLMHCQDRQIEAFGIAELIESLGCYPPDAFILVQPFIGPNSSVTAFWSSAGALVGCVTILGRDSESGQRNLDEALGDR
jgi:hypothetical protein